MGRKRQSTKKKRSTHKKRHFRNSTRRVRKGGDDGIYSPNVEYNEPFANSGVPIDKKQMIQNYKKQFNADRSKKNELRTKMIEDGFTVEETVPVLGKYLDQHKLMDDLNYMDYGIFYKVYNRLLNYGRDRKNENLFYAVYNLLFDDKSKIYDALFGRTFNIEAPPTVVKEVEYCKKRNCINTLHYLWGITPLHLAAIQAPMSIDYTNYGRVIREEDKKVLVSVQDGREEIERIINYLIDNGADVNAVDNYGNTPLLYAAFLNEPFNIDGNVWFYPRNIENIIELLINKGAKINKHNWFKITPLMWASRRSTPEMIQKMIDKGADINARTDSGRTALDFARKENNEGVVALLQHNGAKSYRKL